MRSEQFKAFETLIVPIFTSMYYGMDTNLIFNDYIYGFIICSNYGHQTKCVDFRKITKK